MRSIYLLLPFLVMSVACKAQTEEKAEGGDVNVTKALELIEKEATLVLLDVRSPKEVANGAIEGSVNINFHDSDFKEQIAKLSKEKKYLVYCHSGGRSSKALKLMTKQGFTVVYNLDGGITAWQAAGQEVKK